VVAALVIAVAAMATYWALWFADRSVVASETARSYVQFENAFPLADGWLTICLLGALVALGRRSSLALFWLLAGGGAGLYLFCMDVLYDAEHGVWARGAGGAIEAAINALTVTLSGLLLRWAWRNRRVLDPLDM
jgi:hypothetical protein